MLNVIREIKRAKEYAIEEQVFEIAAALRQLEKQAIKLYAEREADPDEAS